MGAELAALRAELARERTRAELQALRAAALGGQAAALRLETQTIRASFFWRLTAPLRLLVEVARGRPPAAAVELRRFLVLARTSGLGHAFSRVRARLLRGRKQAVHASPPPGGQAGETPPAPASLLEPLVLIIAEVTLPQCTKYRVWQKQEHFARLGVRVRVVDWRDFMETRAAAALATQAILYRVPGYPNVMETIAMLHSYGVPTAWEVDDLIFDRALYLDNRNLDALSPEQRDGILSGVSLYRGAMLACRTGIASTEPLAAAMRGAGLAQVHVVENALDEETLTEAARIRAARAGRDAGAPILIGYGSGTKTHDADFRVAAPALLRLLAARPEVRLRIVGELNLPAEFDAFPDQVERLPPTHYTRFLELLGGCDISIAPLEPGHFNDAKSNIKFLEAAILALPSVCSPAANFRAVIEPGRNGYLAATEAEWFAALDRLAGSAALRAEIGAASCATALARYAPEAVARAQVAPLAVRDARPPRPPLSVLIANVYFPPRRYGGATLVAEEMARRLNARGDTRVTVFTALDQADDPQVLRRWQDDGMTVFAAPIGGQDVVSDFDNPVMGQEFGRVLDAVRPDVVHLHSVQWMSASLADACRARGIPYVITVHDSWWLCPRQFMVREDGQYCHQSRIDLRVCQACVPGARHLEARRDLLTGVLLGAARVLSPSEPHRQLHIANGIPPDLIEVAPNGVRLPEPGFQPKRAGGLRFAYVGGNVDIKGYSIVRRAFETLPAGDWELVLVDNTLNLGFSSVDPRDWRIAGALRVVPAYVPEALDDFFADIDVLVFPSQWKESFGLTVREALARGVWVVATAGGGPADAIEDGVNGDLIPLDGRHDRLAEILRDMLAAPERLRAAASRPPRPILDFAAQAEALRETLLDIVHGTA